MGDIQGQFIQKVYLWTPDWNAYIGAIAHGLQTVSVLFIVPLLTNVIKISDVNLAMIGFIALFLMNMVKGSWMSPLGEFDKLS